MSEGWDGTSDSAGTTGYVVATTTSTGVSGSYGHTSVVGCVAPTPTVMTSTGKVQPPANMIGNCRHQLMMNGYAYVYDPATGCYTVQIDTGAPHFTLSIGSGPHTVKWEEQPEPEPYQTELLTEEEQKMLAELLGVEVNA